MGCIPGESVRHFATVEEAQTQPESEDIAAKTTANPFATTLATAPAVDSDSKLPSKEAAWRSGETYPSGTYPPPLNTDVDDMDGDIEDGVL